MLSTVYEQDVHDALYVSNALVNAVVQVSM